MKKVMSFLMTVLLAISLQAEEGYYKIPSNLLQQEIPKDIDLTRSDIVNGSFDDGATGWGSSIFGDGNITYPSNTVQIVGHNNGGGTGDTYISQTFTTLAENNTIVFDLNYYYSTDGWRYDTPRFNFDGTWYYLRTNGTVTTSTSGIINNDVTISSPITFVFNYSGAGEHTVSFGVNSLDGIAGAGIAIFDNIINDATGVAPVNLLSPKASGIVSPGADLESTNGLWSDADEGDILTYTYQWQSSTDDVTYSDISGANAEIYEVPFDQALLYYRCEVTCTDANPVPHSEIAYSNMLHYQNQVPTFDDAPLVYKVISEDNDPTPFELDLGVTDGDDGETLTWTIKTQPQFGVASVVTRATYGSAGISYTPDLNFNGDDSGDVDDIFVVKVTDGKSFDEIVVYVELIAVNDAPVLVGAGGTTAFIENDVPLQVIDNSDISDVDDEFFINATIEISSNYQNGEDVLNYVDANGITGTWDASTGIMTLVGTADRIAYQAALNSVAYSNDLEDPSPLTREVTFMIQDESSTEAGAEKWSAPITQTLTVYPVNDDPVLEGGELEPPLYVENAEGIIIADNFSITDYDDTEMDTIGVWIENGYPEDVLEFTDTPNLTGTFYPVVGGPGKDGNKSSFNSRDEYNGALIIRGRASIAEYEAALNSITYRNTSENPVPGLRALTFMVVDAASSEPSNIGFSNPAMQEVEIYPVNDAPVLTGAGGTTDYVENDPPMVIADNFDISDFDDENMIEMEVVITNYKGEEDELMLEEFGPPIGRDVGYEYTYINGILTVEDIYGIDEFIGILNSVKYYNNSDNPDTETRSITFRVKDQSISEPTAMLWSNTVTQLVTIDNTNDDPGITGAGGMTDYIEYGSDPLSTEYLPVNVIGASPAIEIVDPDATSDNMKSALVTILAEGPPPPDRAEIGDVLTIDVTGTNIEAEYNYPVLTLTGVDTRENYAMALNTVEYYTTVNNPTDFTSVREIEFKVEDSELPDANKSWSNSVIQTIMITPTNDEPIISGAGGTTSYTEADGYGTTDPVQIISNAGIVDDNDFNGMDRIFSAEISIFSGYESNNDYLLFAAMDSVVASFDQPTGVLTLTTMPPIGLTRAKFVTILNSVEFANDNDDPSTISRFVGYKVYDGEYWSEMIIQEVTITPTNDTPQISGFPIPDLSRYEDFPQVSINLNTHFTDVDGDVLSYTFTQSNSNVDIEITGNIMTLNSQEDWNGDLDIIVTADDGYGTEKTSSSKKVTSNRADVSDDFIFTVTAVNDEPTFVKGLDIEVDEDSGDFLEAGWATSYDRGDETTANLEAGQTLTMTVVADVPEYFSAQPEIDEISGDLTFTLTPEFNGSTSLTVVLTDNGGTEYEGDDESTQYFEITINAKNDAPVNTSIPTIEVDDIIAIGSDLLLDFEGDWNDDLDNDINIFNEEDITILTASYQWQRSSDVVFTTPEDIENATNTTYTMTHDDKNMYVRLAVIMSDNGTGEPLVQSTTAYSEPVFVANNEPVLSGNDVMDFDEDLFSYVILTADDFDSTEDLVWSSTDPVNGSVVISEVPASSTQSVKMITFTSNPDWNGTESFTVTVTDGTDVAELLITANVAPLNDEPINTEIPVITPTEGIAVGTVLTVSNGAWNDIIDTDVSGSSTITYEYQWMRDGLDIAGEVMNTYTFADADQDLNIQVRLTATDDGVGTPVNQSVVVFSTIVNSGNNSPLITEDNFTLNAVEETAIQFTLNATDPDNGENLSWAIEQDALLGTLSEIVSRNSTGQVTYEYVGDLNVNTFLNGTDEIKIRVSDNDGAFDEITITVDIAGVNDSPHLIVAIPEHPQNEDFVPFNIDMTEHFADVDADELTYVLDFVDTELTCLVDENEYLVVSSVLNWHGTSSITVTAYDGDGEHAESTFLVPVIALNDPPVYTVEPVLSGDIYVGSSLNVTDGSWNDDADGNPVSSITMSRTWQRADDASFTVNSTIVGDDSNDYVIAPADKNKYMRVLITATDQGTGTPEIASTNFYTSVIYIENNEIVITPSSVDFEIDEDDVIGYEFTLTAVDEDNFEYLTWDVSDPSKGVVSEVVRNRTTEESKTYLYIPNTDASGADAFTVEVSDGTEITVVDVTIDIVSINDAPVISSTIPGQSVNVGALITLDLSDYEYDVDNSDEELNWELTVTNYDFDGDGTDFAGEVIQTAPGSDIFIFNPQDINFSGQLEFTATLSDGSLTAEQVGIVMDWSDNTPPVIDLAILDYNEDEDDNIVITLTDANKSDAEDPDELLVWSIVGAVNCVATVDGNIITLDPAEDYNGTVSVDLVLTDSNQGTDSESLNLTWDPVNDAPIVLTPIEDLNLDENFDVIEIDLNEHFFDIDGDDLYFAASASNSTLLDYAINNGILSLTHRAYVHGSTMIQVTANDLNVQATDIFNVVVNDVDWPIEVVEILPNDGSQVITMNEGDVTYFSIDAFDPDGNDLSYEWTLNTVPVSGTASYDFLTNFNSAGEHQVSLTVTDNENRSSLIYNWTVIVNDVPQNIVVEEILPNDGGIIAIDELESVDFSVTAYDPDGNDLTYVWKQGEDVVSVETSWVFTTDYTSAGTYGISLTISDGQGRDEVNYAWSIEVADVDQPIVVTELLPAVGFIEIEEMEVINFSIDAIDPDGNDLVYSWKVNSVEFSNSATYDFLTDYTSAGDYVITLDVSDGFGTRNDLNYSWDVTVTDVDQPIVVEDLSYAIDNSGVWTTEAQVIVEMEELNFFVLASDPDLNDLEYSWKLNGSEVSIESTYDFITDYNSAGIYVVTLDITDGFVSRNDVNYSWDVEVTNVDQPIVITDLTYATETGGVWTTVAQTIAEGDSLNFAIVATDPDGEDLTYSWKVDGNEVSIEAMVSYTTDYNSAGNYVVTLDVSDGFVSRNDVNYSWDVEVTNVNQAPVITAWEPVLLTINLDVDPTVDFSVTAEDPDLDELTYSWTVDGTEEGTESTFTFDFINDTFDVVVTVSDGEYEETVAWVVISSVGINDNNLPLVTELSQNYPNPFNPVTTINYSLEQGYNGKVTVIVYNEAGKTVQTLVNKKQTSGMYSISFNGNGLASGIYYYGIKTENYSSMKKMILVK